ncbi:subtilisin family serine protease [Nitrobacteraceae bacterium AZCC 1564]
MIRARNAKRNAERVRAIFRYACVAVTTSVVASFVVPIAHAQSYTNFSVRSPSVMRTPSINVGPRISVNPNVRYSPNVQYDGIDQPRPQARPRAARNVEQGQAKSARDAAPPRRTKKSPATVADNSYVAKEVLIEIDGTPSDEQVDGITRRHRLTRVQSQNFALTNSTFFRWRITDGRSVDTVVRELMASGDVRSAQRNNIFKLQQQSTSSEGDPAQYALAKMRLPEAHALSVGADVTVAVIDSGVDVTHPELAGVIAGTFDALNSEEGPHPHGTGIAGVIAAHGRLMGTAPSAHLLAIRAFGAKKSGPESTSFILLKSLNYAVANGAQVVNMSFAGPHDPVMQRALAAAAAKGVVLVAAAGNAGPKSPPLYPAADPNVIAVSATDQSDRLFVQSNRGSYVAIAAPGVDILSPAPDGKYQMASGTSLSSAFISGLVALLIARNPDLSATDIRATLASTARDLGPKGRDDQFGAGQADAFGAVSAVAPAPLAAASDKGTTR